MYHCHIQFYLIGRPCPLFTALRALPPLEAFSHSIWESETWEDDKAAQADVIFAVLEAGGIRRLASLRKRGSELILLGRWTPGLPEVDDLWSNDMSSEEISYRLKKWQRDYKLRMDLWESRQFLDICINSSPSLVWFKTKDGIHELVNESFCTAAGKTQEDIQGQSHAYIWNVPQDDPACIESEEAVMRNRETYVTEESILTGIGPKLLTTYKSPLYDLDGSVMGTVGVALDVTQERAYEQDLLEQNRALETILSTIDCGVMCHSVDGQELLSINPAALALLGYESLDELAQDGFDLVAPCVLPEDQPILRNCISDLTEVGKSVTAEYRVRHKDGTILYILGSIKLIEENGQRYYQRFLLDYTAQKQESEVFWDLKNQELRYQEQIFESFSSFLADNVDDIYMMLDEDGTGVEFVTTNVERILGIPWTMVKDSPLELGRPTYLNGESVDYSTLRHMIPYSPPLRLETERIHRQTGEARWFLECISCVSIQGEKKFVVYISDRTREHIAENSMTTALEIAQIANKTKNTILGSVSQDIYTPMSDILSFIPLLQAEKDSPDRVMEYSQSIDAATRRLLSMVNHVLDLHKFENGSAVLNIGPLNMAEVIHQLNAIIRPQVRSKDQTLDVYASSLAYEHLLGDGLRLNQILLNILTNAVSYTPQGGKIELWVYELPQGDPDHSRIRFTVRDNGQGMSEEYQRVIFDPFTREDSPALLDCQGAGLGMAITKRLVDLMQGTISVSSKPGVGSIFTVELELPIQKQENDASFCQDHGISRMLVADSDEDICRDIRKKMAETGVLTHYATEAQQALDMIRQAQTNGAPYDLLLLDWQLPELDRAETARLASGAGKAPILLFTAYDWVDIEAEATQAGIRHFLPKPFFRSNFQEVIREVLTHESQEL